MQDILLTFDKKYGKIQRIILKRGIFYEKSRYFFVAIIFDFFHRRV